MKISFADKSYRALGVVTANSYRWHEVADFLEEADCVVNGQSDALATGYDNASLMLTEPFAGSTQIETRCSFDAWGAPLIVISRDLDKDTEGIYRYREYYEVVLYEEGVNVWRMTTDENDEVTWKKMMSVSFPVAPKEIHTLTVRVLGDTLEIKADDREMSVCIPEPFTRYFVGIDACENINRFYDLSVTPLSSLEGGFTCTFCGYRHAGDEPPARCPDCGVGAEKFKKINL